MIDVRMVADNYAVIKQRVADIGSPDVDVIAVTKGFGPQAIVAAIAAGAVHIGENYVQELVDKLGWLDSHVPPIDRSDLQVHMIGQLQSNKVRHLSGLVDLYETVDRPKLALEIAKRDPRAAVLIQVDTTDEPGKGGVPLARLDDLVETVIEEGLNLRGLMTVGPTHGDPRAARHGFVAVRKAVDRYDLTVCSMGMSSDFEMAVELGATEVRIGSAIFGPRPVRARA